MSSKKKLKKQLHKQRIKYISDMSQAAVDIASLQYKASIAEHKVSGLNQEIEVLKFQLDQLKPKEEPVLETPLVAQLAE